MTVFYIGINPHIRYRKTEVRCQNIFPGFRVDSQNLPIAPARAQREYFPGDIPTILVKLRIKLV